MLGVISVISAVPGGRLQLAQCRCPGGADGRGQRGVGHLGHHRHPGEVQPRAGHGPGTHVPAVPLVLETCWKIGSLFMNKITRKRIFFTTCYSPWTHVPAVPLILETCWKIESLLLNKITRKTCFLQHVTWRHV